MKAIVKMLAPALRAAVMGFASIILGTVAQADEVAGGIKDRRIGYVLNDMGWAVYQTGDGSKQCPQGFNTQDLRKDFKAFYPNGGPVKDTQLVREGLKIFPEDKPPQFPFHEVQSDIAFGFNLDGKVGPKDFLGPNGETGIDNAFYRAIGCTTPFHSHHALGAIGGRYVLTIPSYAFMRMMIEISELDSLQNDGDVEVTLYRGRDPFQIDASGAQTVPGASQRIDNSPYGRTLIQHFRGRIEDGVLTTNSIENGVWPWQLLPHLPKILRIHDMRLRVKLSPTKADMMIGGYLDIESVNRWLRSYPTHYLSFSAIETPEFYWALRRNADAYPDEHGVMTAISAAITVDMTQVFVIHPDATAGKAVAAK